MLEFLRMQIRQILGGRKKWLVAACLVLPVLLSLAVVSTGGLREAHRDAAAFGGIYFFLLYAQAVSLLLALFYGTSVLGDELDGKTVTYLFTRPTPRWQFVLGKYLGIVLALVPPTGLSLLASWLCLGGIGGIRLFAALLVGTTGALMVYNALFVLFGFLIPRRAMITALLYGIFVELFLSFIPAVVNEFTITYHLRSLVVAMLDIEIPREVARMVGGSSPLGAVLALLAIAAGSLGLSSWLAARAEYVVKDTA